MLTITVQTAGKEKSIVGPSFLSAILQDGLKKKVVLDIQPSGRTSDGNYDSELKCLLQEAENLLLPPRTWIRNSRSLLPEISMTRSNRACLLHATEAVEKVRHWVRSIEPQVDRSTPEAERFAAAVLPGLEDKLSRLLQNLRDSYRQPSAPNLFDSAEASLRYLETLFDASVEVRLKQQGAASNNGKNGVDLTRYRRLSEAAVKAGSLELSNGCRPAAAPDYRMSVSAGEVLDPDYAQRLILLSRQSGWQRLKLRLRSLVG